VKRRNGDANLAARDKRKQKDLWESRWKQEMNEKRTLSCFDATGKGKEIHAWILWSLCGLKALSLDCETLDSKYFEYAVLTLLSEKDLEMISAQPLVMTKFSINEDSGPCIDSDFDEVSDLMEIEFRNRHKEE
jgi:hypothetical protein